MNFLALMDNITAFYGRVYVDNLAVVYRNAALLYKSAGFAVACADTRRNKHGDYCCGLCLYCFFGQVAAAAERRFCLSLRL